MVCISANRCITVVNISMVTVININIYIFFAVVNIYFIVAIVDVVSFIPTVANIVFISSSIVISVEPITCPHLKWMATLHISS